MRLTREYCTLPYRNLKNISELLDHTRVDRRYKSHDD